MFWSIQAADQPETVQTVQAESEQRGEM
jgi:hypothetical protein